MLRSCLSRYSCSPTAFAFAISSSNVEKTELLSFTSPSHCCKTSKRQHRFNGTKSKRLLKSEMSPCPALTRGLSSLSPQPADCRRCKTEGTTFPAWNKSAWPSPCPVATGHAAAKMLTHQHMPYKREHKPQRLLHLYKARRDHVSSSKSSRQRHRGKESGTPRQRGAEGKGPCRRKARASAGFCLPASGRERHQPATLLCETE